MASRELSAVPDQLYRPAVHVFPVLPYLVLVALSPRPCRGVPAPPLCRRFLVVCRPISAVPFAFVLNARPECNAMA